MEPSGSVSAPSASEFLITQRVGGDPNSHRDRLRRQSAPIGSCRTSPQLKRIPQDAQCTGDKRHILGDCELALPHFSCDFCSGYCSPFSTRTLSTDSMALQDRNQINLFLFVYLPSVLPSAKRLITKGEEVRWVGSARSNLCRVGRESVPYEELESIGELPKFVPTGFRRVF